MKHLQFEVTMSWSWHLVVRTDFVGLFSLEWEIQEQQFALYVVIFGTK